MKANFSRKDEKWIAFRDVRVGSASAQPAGATIEVMSREFPRPRQMDLIKSPRMGLFGIGLARKPTVERLLNYARSNEYLFNESEVVYGRDRTQRKFPGESAFTI